MPGERLDENVMAMRAALNNVNEDGVATWIAPDASL